MESKWKSETNGNEIYLKTLLGGGIKENSIPMEI